MLAFWSLVPLPFLNLVCTSGSSQCTYCWSLAWNILSITLTSMWNECNCAVVWTFFGTALLWDWNENWPFRIGQSKSPNAGKNVEQEPSLVVNGNAKMVQQVWKTVWPFLTKLNILLPYDPTIALFDICPKELKTYVYTEICTQVFIANVFLIAKTCKQLSYSSIGEWISCGISR